MGSLSERNRAKKEEKILRLKQDLLADLYHRRGAYWEAIRSMRSQWNVSASVGIPPSYPDPPTPPDWLDWPHNGEEARLYTQWSFDLNSLQDQHIPEQYRDDFWDVLGWQSFLAACVLYDPPEIGLREFAEFGGPRPLGIMPAERSFDPDFEPEYVLIPSVKQHRDWVAATAIEVWLREAILHRLGEQLNLDLRRMALDMMPELREAYCELLEERAPFRYYIEVDEHTTAEDIEVARRAIQASQKREVPPGGRPAGLDRWGSWIEFWLALCAAVRALRAANRKVTQENVAEHLDCHVRELTRWLKQYRIDWKKDVPKIP